MSEMGIIASKALQKAVDFGIEIEDLKAERNRLRKANEELVFQLDIALKTLGELRQGFEQELSGDTCANIDAIIAKGEKALQSSEECK